MDTVDERIMREEFLSLAVPTVEPEQVISKTFGAELFIEVSDVFRRDDDVRAIFGETQRLCQQTMANNPTIDLTHGPLHGKNVALYTGAMVKKSLGEGADEYTVRKMMKRSMLGGVLHDSGRTCFVPVVEEHFAESPRFAGHAKRSVSYARFILYRYGFPEEEIEPICQAIDDHPYTKSRLERLRLIKKSVNGLLSRSLMDGDGIDREANQASYIIYRALINGETYGRQIRNRTCSHRGEFERRTWQTDGGKHLFETVLTLHDGTGLYDLSDSVLGHLKVVPEDLRTEFVKRFAAYAGPDSWNVV
jgi:hypothetical protein